MGKAGRKTDEGRQGHQRGGLAAGRANQFVAVYQGRFTIAPAGHHVAAEILGQVLAPQRAAPGNVHADQVAVGGQAVREKYGPEFYSKIGKMGGDAVKEKRGPQFYADIGKKGGDSTKSQHGSAFYSRIGKEGGKRGSVTAAPKE